MDAYNAPTHQKLAAFGRGGRLVDLNFWAFPRYRAGTLRYSGAPAAPGREGDGQQARERGGGPRRACVFCSEETTTSGTCICSAGRWPKLLRHHAAVIAVVDQARMASPPLSSTLSSFSPLFPPLSSHLLSLLRYSAYPFVSIQFTQIGSFPLSEEGARKPGTVANTLPLYITTAHAADNTHQA